MKKGQKKRVWMPEQKAEIVRKHLEEHVSVRTLEREYQADRSMICRWVKRYIAEGESSFERKKPRGNRFAALHTSKNLSEIERLRLMVLCLKGIIHQNFSDWKGLRSKNSGNPILKSGFSFGCNAGSIPYFV